MFFKNQMSESLMHYLLLLLEADADTKAGEWIQFEVRATEKWNLLTLKYTVGKNV